MEKTRRIYLNEVQNDKYFKIKLNQNVTSIEILSLKLNTKDAYRKFNADYGILIGRVTANNGVGIINAKISIFIPIKDEDKTNEDILAIYPYKTPTDKNKEGKRYNLLPRVAKKNPKTGVISPKQPFGSFQTKAETLTNSTYLEIYEKYYKYSTVTNDSGDYMIFGVPIGTQTVHMSVDITDIGKYSMTPTTMVQYLGYSKNLFTPDLNKVKLSNDLNDLPHIETQEVTTEIIPFWGDAENYEVGITQQDFRIRAQLVNTITIFGSAFTDDDKVMWGEQYYSGLDTDTSYANELYRISNPAPQSLSISTKRIGKVTENFYYYSNKISDDKINNDIDGSIVKKMSILNKNDYISYKRKGDFIYILQCNRKKIITDELGNEIEVPDDYNGGIYTEFCGFMTIEISDNEIPMDFVSSIDSIIENNAEKGKIVPFRYKLKFPQSGSTFGDTFMKEDEIYASHGKEKSDRWRKQNYVFKAGKIYSISRYHGIVSSNQNVKSDDNFNVDRFDWNNTRFFILKRTENKKEKINDPYQKDPFFSPGILIAKNTDDVSENDNFEFPANVETEIDSLQKKVFFGANWLNFTAYLPQVSKFEGTAKIRDMHANTEFTANPKEPDYVEGNDQLIAGVYTNTQYFARSDINKTAFIEVPKEDILKIYNYDKKGFTSDDISGHNIDLHWDNYKKEGYVDGNASGTEDHNYYFYRGVGEADCIDFIVNLGLV